MAKPARLATGSVLTTDDQKRLYEEAMGKDALARQVTAADAEAGRCTCMPTTVRRKWEGSDKTTGRRVHAPECPRWKTWMTETRS